MFDFVLFRVDPTAQNRPVVTTRDQIKANPIFDPDASGLIWEGSVWKSTIEFAIREWQRYPQVLLDNPVAKEHATSPSFETVVLVVEGLRARTLERETGVTVADVIHALGGMIELYIDKEGIEIEREHEYHDSDVPKKVFHEVDPAGTCSLGF